MLANLCSYRDVTESLVSLADIATMNELLDLKDYNDWVAQQHANPPEQLPMTNPFDVFRR